MGRITSYSVSVAQASYLDDTRVFRLRLESGTNVYAAVSPGASG